MQIYLSTKLRAPMWYINCKIYIWCRIKRSECTNKTACVNVSSEIVLISCSSWVCLSLEFAQVGRKEHDLPCLAFQCTDRSIISSSRRPYYVFTSLLSILYTLTIFPAFCLLCILRYMPFSLITFRMCADAARFARPSLDFSIFVLCITMHEASSCKQDDLGLRNAKISSTYTRRFGRKREATSWDSLATKRRISNYDLLLLASSFARARQSAFICTNNVSLKFLRFLSVRFASRMFLHKY